MKNPIFICGHRKCGTSMFFNLFDGHSRLLVYPSDLNLLYAYFPKYLSNEYTYEDRKMRLGRVIFADIEDQQKSNNIDTGLDIGLFKEMFFSSLTGDLTDIKEIIAQLYYAYEKLVQRPNMFPAFKETSLEIYAHEIFEWFPDAKIIQLIRDPRDNYSALKAGVDSYYRKLGENEKETLASMIYRAKLGMKIGLYNQKKYGPNKYKIIKFEELVSDVQTKMQEISDFIGIQFEPSMLLPTKEGHSTAGNSFDGEKFNKVTAKNVGRWRERISEHEAKIIEFHFEDLMNNFKYRLEFSKEECVKSAVDFYKWHNYRYFYNDRF